MTVRRRRRKALIAWVRDQHGQITAAQLAAVMSCEALPYDRVPLRLRQAVTEFRHLGQNARVAACRRYLAEAVS